MNEFTVKILLEPLLKATKQNQLPWEDDPSGGVVVPLGPNIVNVYSRKEYDRDLITIRILDAEKRVVDFSDIDRADAYYEEVDELLRLARNKALRKDDVIQEALQALAQLS